MKIKPLADRVIVEKIDEGDEIRSGGFALPGSEIDEERKKITKGIVVAIGSGRRDENVTEDEKKDGATAFIPIEVAIGDTVYFVKYNGNDFHEDGKDYKILDEVNILAVVEKEK